MSEQEDKNLLDFAVRSSLTDDAGLKTTWYNHVLKTLEKLDDHVDKLTADMYEQKDLFKTELYNLKEKIRTETADVRSLEIVENHLNEVIQKLDTRIASVEKNQSTEHIKAELEVLRQEVSTHKQDWTSQITISEKTIKEELGNAVTLVNNKVIALEIKLALIGVISGMVGSGLVAIIVIVLRNYLFSGGTP